MPMTIKDLKASLKGIPDNAIVYIEADHGQLPQRAYYLSITSDKNNLDYSNEDIDWQSTEDVYPKNITAILIS